MSPILCRHCAHYRAGPRQNSLCEKCRRTPAILCLYPSTSKYVTNRGRQDATAPCAATLAMPGSEDKIAVLTERARLHQALWNEADPVELVKALRRIVARLPAALVREWLAG